ncbi:MAG: hypothetical protein ACFCU1_09885 [Sumerlaeia bacterium]
MIQEFPLLAHVAFGVFGIFTAFAVAVESYLLPKGSTRKVNLAFLTLFFMGGALIFGGYWYLVEYPANKEFILTSSAPWAHKVVMEAKEHIFFLIMMLAVLLPISTLDELRRAPGTKAQHITFVISSAIVLLGLMMEGMGGMISLAVRLGLKGAA